MPNIWRYGCEEWIKRLRIIDSTTISLFSNAIFKGVGRHPRTGRKKGGIKVHSVIHANEGVPCDVRFTSAATNDSFMLTPNYYQHNEIVAMDRAYINYEKFEELTEKNVAYVTKMKKNTTYSRFIIHELTLLTIHAMGTEMAKVRRKVHQYPR